jgi:hypothetical protein
MLRKRISARCTVDNQGILEKRSIFDKILENLLLRARSQPNLILNQKVF